VTTAVLLATAASEDGGPAAALPFGDGTVLSRLMTQLAELGVSSARVITRPGWEDRLRPSLEDAGLSATLRAGSEGAALHGAGEGDLLVAPADVVLHLEVLRGMLDDPRISTGALCTNRPLAPPDTREKQGRIVSAASSYHTVSDPNVRFLEILKVGVPDRRALEEALDRLAALPEPKDITSLALVGLVRAGVVVVAVPLRDMFWARPAMRPEAERAAHEIVELDEDRLLLDAAVKANDSFFTTFFVSPYSKYVARWAARRGWTPNLVTTISLGIGVLAALAFATGERGGLIAGALLLQLSFTTDCVDGQLARYTRTFSRLGGWLDAVFDRTKEYAVYAGLAIGASRSGDPVWVLAGSALALQTIRHAIEFSYLVLELERLAAGTRPPLEEPSDRPSAAGQTDGQAGRAPAAWDRLNRLAAIRWAKLFVAFPIGERFAAISITAALASARTTFVVLLAWGGIATAYKMIGRIARSVLR
jgi:phosphatidylglycerophosphate synthase